MIYIIYGVADRIASAIILALAGAMISMLLVVLVSFFVVLPVASIGYAMADTRALALLPLALIADSALGGLIIGALFPIIEDCQWGQMAQHGKIKDGVIWAK